MRRITIWGARELRIVAARDRLDQKTWREVRMNEARAQTALARLVRDAAAMASARALLAEVNPGAATFGLDDHDVVRDLAWYVARRECRAFERVARPAGSAPAPAPQAPAPPPAAAPAAKKAPERKVLTVKWELAEAWCSDTVRVSGTTQEYADGEALLVEVRDRASGKQVASVQASVSGNAFAKSWPLKDVLPEKSGGKFVKKMDLDASASGVKAPAPLAAKFAPEAARTPYASGRSHFAMTVAEYVAKIEAELKFVPGWGAEVVNLGPAVPAATGGVVAALAWPGYRWMRRNEDDEREYWNGAAWVGLPAGFALRDGNHFCVGFYKSGASFACQYGGTWPGAFPDWSVDAAANRSKLRDWERNIETTWTGKFDLERDGCQSVAPACCRYRVEVKAQFQKQAAFAAGMLIVAAGNIRSNDSLWFLGESRLAVAAHEFGHHLGNGDEYAGATSVDPTLNDDGAANGLDPSSIMGANLGAVKKRHLRTVCSHLASMIRSAYGKSYTYKAVPP